MIEEIPADEERTDGGACLLRCFPLAQPFSSGALWLGGRLTAEQLARRTSLLLAALRFYCAILCCLTIDRTERWRGTDLLTSCTPPAPRRRAPRSPRGPPWWPHLPQIFASPLPQLRCDTRQHQRASAAVCAIGPDLTLFGATDARSPRKPGSSSAIQPARPARLTGTFPHGSPDW